MSGIDHYTCEHVFQRLEDYVDRELTPREMELVREHLEICALCAAEHKFQTQAIQAVRERVQRIAASPDLTRKIHLALQMACAEITAENEIE